MEKYSTGQESHFDIFNSYDVCAPAGEVEHVSLHAGWEINFTRALAPYTKQVLHVRGRKHVLDEKSILLFNSLEEHTEIYPEDRTTRAMALVFPLPFLDGILAESGARATEVVFDQIAHGVTPEISEKFATLISLRGEGPSVSRLAFECFAVDLVLTILEAYSSSASANLKLASQIASFPSNIARVKRLVAENIADADFNLDDLAERAGISKFHLIRSFKARTGVSPARFVNSVRIDLAKTLLSKGEPVNRVAMQSGFNTFSAFNKAFKRQVGVAPSAYSKS